MKTLADSTTEILDRLAMLSPASPRQFGSMTPNQMICHLNDSHRLVLGERTASKTGTILHRSVIKFLALRMSTWPPGSPTRPEMDQQAGGTPPVQFEADRAELVTLIGRFAALPQDYRFPPHPIFGQMSRWKWMRWGYLHANHHLRQFGV